MKNSELIEKCYEFRRWLDLDVFAKNLNKEPRFQPENGKYCVWKNAGFHYAMEKIERTKLKNNWQVITVSNSQELANDRLYGCLLARHYAYLSMANELKTEQFKGIKTFGLYRPNKDVCEPVFVLNNEFYTQVVEDGIIVDFVKISQKDYHCIIKGNTNSVKVDIGHYAIVAYYFYDRNREIDIRYVGRKNDIAYLLEFYLNDKRLYNSEKEYIRKLIK